MIEVKVTISAPELSSAIVALADAVKNAPVSAAKSSNEISRPSPEIAAQPAPVAAPAPVTAPALPTTAQPVQAPAQPVVAAQPVQPAQTNYTVETLAAAGAALMERGMMPQLMAALGKYGVQALTQLKADQLPAFAAELRALGASI